MIAQASLPVKHIKLVVLKFKLFNSSLCKHLYKTDVDGEDRGKRAMKRKKSNESDSGNCSRNIPKKVCLEKSANDAASTATLRLVCKLVCSFSAVR